MMTILNIIGKNIKKYRDKAGLTQEQLADKCGISKNAVYMYEKGKRTPKPNIVAKLAEALSLFSPNDLYMDKHEPLPKFDWGPAEDENYLWVPVVEIEACAGNGHEYPEYCMTTVDTRPIPKTDLIGHSWQNSGYKIFSIAGDSMEPRFSDGDDVLVSIDENLVTGNIVVAWWHGKLYIRGFINQGNKVILKPLNPKYSQIEIEHGDTDLYIIGKVIARVPKIEKVDSIY